MAPFLNACHGCVHFSETAAPLKHTRNSALLPGQLHAALWQLDAMLVARLASLLVQVAAVLFRLTSHLVHSAPPEGAPPQLGQEQRGQ